MKQTDESKNYFSDEIKYNDMMGEKHKKLCRLLNYFEHFLAFVSAVRGCVSISASASLVVIPVNVVISAVWLKNWRLTSGIKNYVIIEEKGNKA